VLPSVTLPNVRLPGRIDIAGVAAAVPVPERVTDEVEAGALLKIDTLPVAPPVVVGANFTLKVAKAPAAMVAGVTIPLIL
jgi:hypothetical protein